MNKWFVVHPLEAFGENQRLLGFAAKTALDGSVCGNKLMVIGEYTYKI